MLASMKLVLSHTSALDFIRAERWRRGELQPARVTTLADCASSLAEVESIRIPAFDQSQGKLEVLVDSPDKACRSKDHICRVLLAPPISGMFCKIADRAYVTSPEMTFVQMANRLDFLDLVRLGMEFCGTYAPCPFSNRFDERQPVTSRNRLMSFCNRASGTRGAATVRKALRWVVEGSNSPAETALVLYLCLPVRMGGYGFALPDMNPETPLGVRASKMHGYNTMRCDLHWVEAATVIEYDSDQEHLTSQSAARDAGRRNVLGYKDIAVITVRKPMVASPGQFDNVARQLARRLGRRLRPRDLEFTPAREDLRIALFPWLKTGFRG